MDFRKIKFRQAELDDAEHIGLLVVLLEIELSDRAKTKQLNILLEDTANSCYEMMKEGNYFAILGYVDGAISAVATLSESYSLSGGGRIGMIQEFYVSPDIRSTGIGGKLMEEVKLFGHQKQWGCIDLSAPTIAKLDEHLGFYEGSGFEVMHAYRMRHFINKPLVKNAKQALTN
ncbi:acetyltransferase, GNAT family protein [Marinomonas sp. MED121]|uniref:GNAT family N-acetyltransferase n=1 Tax=Marinomonas sp. MED121 TaxID=314277 RepID=UPI0000690118|nr:GNAT family N-acetyltransferase [Marinomonas sp. MED121]EAQ65627.1 acetyltransferase, GNAT family protein [Marinomonas sp. MED121]